MSIEDKNVSIIKEMFAGGKDKLEDVLKYIAPEFVRHDLTDAFTGVIGPSGVKDFLQMILTAMPDFQMNIKDIFGAGDKVTVYYKASGTHSGEILNQPPTGKKIECSGIHIYKLKDEKVTETWQLFDIWGFMRQIGVIDVEL